MSRVHTLSARLSVAGFCLYASCFPAIAITTNRVQPTLNDILEAKQIDGLAVSTDGRRIAYRVASQDVARNSTSVSWHSVNLVGQPEEAGLGGPQEPIWMPPFGMLDDPVVQWSPDSRYLYVLEMKNSAVQIHRLSDDGRDAAITNGPSDIRSFRIDPSDGILHYSFGNSRIAIDEMQREEALRGVHLSKDIVSGGFRLTENYRIGDRVTTVRNRDNEIAQEEFSGPDRSRTISLSKKSLSSSQFSVGRPVEAGVYLQDLTRSAVLGTLPGVRSVNINLLEPVDSINRIAHVEIEATLENGALAKCAEDFCRGIFPELRQVILNSERGEVLFLTDEDDSRRMSIYAWAPRSGLSRRIWTGEGTLSPGGVRHHSACPAIGGQLFCIFAGPTRPPELVAIDLATGAMRVLADPNTRLAAMHFPSVRHLRWQSETGYTATGILVLPEDRKGPVPLVITTYTCGGFLQGGVSEVTPEFELVQHGIAALCVDMLGKDSVTITRKAKMAPLEIHKADTGSIAAVIDKLGAEGVIDPTRVGISGQSYSNNVVAYALSHANLFRAASIGGGITIDPSVYYLTAPTADSPRKKTFEMMGLPRPTADPANIWQEISPSMNASRIKAPLLIQSGENEYLFALQLYTSIADAGGKVDMFIFPHGGHMTREQPAQHAIRAARSVAWFCFWLNGENCRNIIAAPEWEHWQELASPAPLAMTDHR
ncbi:prolyl oligopeptidase family serine peptidase [Sphingomonas oryzagri]